MVNDQFNEVELNLATEDSCGKRSKLGSSLVSKLVSLFWCSTDFPLMS
jgi:hypothetical protein